MIFKVCMVIFVLCALFFLALTIVVPTIRGRIVFLIFTILCLLSAREGYYEAYNHYPFTSRPTIVSSVEN